MRDVISASLSVEGRLLILLTEDSGRSWLEVDRERVPEARVGEVLLLFFSCEGDPFPLIARGRNNCFQQYIIKSYISMVQIILLIFFPQPLPFSSKFFMQKQP